MNIKLDKAITLQPEITTDEIQVYQVIDDSTKSEVTAVLNLGEINGQTVMKELTVWNASEYAEAGQWTDEDLIQKIKLLLTK